ncbi:hypothetical protein CLV30_11491 [Haloactinopolyspora alba]|uniref:Excreted virulence factor EspC (Type VII ESX diderm) n=1 Tax=Haloactinopolyspora alba TaxID=648780 RepID=A0A2P8DVY9_9ACTN|nr:hypothetical protein [Haloactinopolyspora alba]PSL01361.1 hypothetical protein CLV30_11491 [Haloactinopolyspora alba]
MSTPPPQTVQALEAEVRQLDRARRALEHALAHARRADERSAADLAAARTRIVDATHRSVPAADDAGIPQRVADAVERAFAAAMRALHERWDRICETIRRALERTAGTLAEKDRTLRRLDDARSRRRSAAG